MQAHKYQRVLSAVTERPWAILPSKLAQITELLVLRADGGEMTEQEIQEAISAETWSGKSSKQQKQGGALAVIPIYGVITPRADLFSEVSGGTGMDQFMGALSAAANDPQVSAILLDVDSPGGQVDMVPEAAAMIRDVRKQKAVYAISNTMAASAGYWLASQASHLFVSPSAEVGSIGVYAAHNDISQAQEKLGVKTTVVSAGKYKTELSPFEPLSDEAKAGIQSKIDEYYSMFANDVAAGRGKSVSDVKGGFGQGRMVTAKNAVNEGMADSVATFDQAAHTILRSIKAAAELGQVYAAEFSGIEFQNTSSTGTATQLSITPVSSTVLSDLQYSEDEKDSVKELSAQERLQKLRAASRSAVRSERESYLAILGRIKK